MSSVGSCLIYYMTFITFSKRWPNKHAKNKGKAILLQAWTGPEGSKELRLPDFMTIGT